MLRLLRLDGFGLLGEVLAAVVVKDVASLAHAHRVSLPLGVLALGSLSVPSVLPIASRTHVLSVVLSVNMDALRDFHRHLGSFLRLFGFVW